ncbi:MAG: hypothetical protein M3T96_05470 [Acidobacteriota bacterium]|nr:hypothetical protein [Acidobacteriota bacterium]
MALKYYSCANCGFWQSYFAAPPDCPVCSDVRNDLPPDGWKFVGADVMEEREKRGEIKCLWREIDEDVWMFSNETPIGIGSSGYLIRRETGNIAFESPGWWTQGAIAKLDELGGVKFISASHPHGFGAIHQLEDYFPGVTIAFQREAVQFTKALAVNFVFDETLAIDGAATLYHVGGHYEGQSVLYYEPRRILFCGDALKFDFDDHGKTVAVSCHKAFHKQIPLSKKEIENYLRVIGALDFRQACTPFEHAADVSTAVARRLFEEQLASHRTTAAPLFIKEPAGEITAE